MSETTQTPDPRLVASALKKATGYLSGAALAGAAGLINAVGNLGGWLAPNIRTWATLTWAVDGKPNEAAGLFALASAGFLGCLLIIGLGLFFKNTQDGDTAQIRAGTVE